MELKDMSARELLDEVNPHMAGAKLYRMRSVLRIVAISDEIERRRKLDEGNGIPAATMQEASCMPGALGSIEAKERG